MVNQKIWVLHKLAHKVHFKMHIHLIDLLQYRPKYIVKYVLQASVKLAMNARILESWEAKELFYDMTIS